MQQLRAFVKLFFGVLTIWLAMIWARLLDRPGFLSPETDIEPLTVMAGAFAVLLLGFWKTTPDLPKVRPAIWIQKPEADHGAGGTGLFRSGLWGKLNEKVQMRHSPFTYLCP